ncbi:MAG TPA: FAD-dependent oxidoreductase [Candidatus Paceibacterota bacterium]|nr:FAD-dependent oxidoreductase [Verrucomicrobiota bacterium]HOX04430.1 FAD-dependent oxidoreductase [Verrucomicrobiota bacterium]HRZ47374.1 FAD-dependent oxidoreductase [Candidatus Paceibacterota bacterium]HRZ92210.1 FAD-dependent oxidoreductase [Candidatus Paceibacterota bacterium]
MNRDIFLQRLRDRREPWDIAVVGGGATGIGIAVDAASRGYSVVLVEQSDFGKGTSSRSTKLVHGGVRYLQQGNISLVMEALKERGLLLQNAPHLVHDLPFVVPNYQWWEAPFYGIGLKVYDMLAGKYGFGRSKLLSAADVLERIPTLEREGLRGGVLYHDGQFDDSRLLVNLAQTAAEQGACLLNHTRCTGLLKDADGYVNGLTFHDNETGQDGTLAARSVINATGPFCDDLRQKDEPAASPMIAPSQGVHIVLPRQFLPRATAIMVPHTRDGRVMFAIPWNGHVVVGTTDTPISTISLEPKPMDQEIDFILETAGGYLAQRPARADILSVFAGIRPLMKSGDASNTAALSRDHAIQISKSGLLTITGGKWTTYRKMAEDCVDHAIVLARLTERPCVTRDLHVHGFHRQASQFGALASYGSDAIGIDGLIRTQPDWARPLHESLPICGAQIVWAARHEMARTLDDVLARRTRALYLNAKAAIAMAPAVSALMAAELKRDEAWRNRQLAEFEEIAAGFVVRL